MTRFIKTLICAGAVALVLAPIEARADGFVVPWVGSAFGSSIDNGRGTFGVSAGGMGAGIVGGEFDFGYNPSFFGTNTDFGSNSILSFMGNVIVGVPIGGTHGAGVRPYAVGGLGLIRSQIDGQTNLFQPSSSNNMLGWDLGFRRDGLLQRPHRNPWRRAVSARARIASTPEWESVQRRHDPLLAPNDWCRV